MENEMHLIDANKLMVCHINVGTVMFPKMEAFVRAEDIKAAPIVDAVVLPCKVGDTVWIVGEKFPAEICAIKITGEGTFFEYVEYDRGYEETEVWDDGEFQTTDIGNTVFLTPEEAEAAFAKMEKEGLPTDNLIDPTGTPLTPSFHGEDCLGNGEHPGIECRCDECPHYLTCFPDWKEHT